MRWSGTDNNGSGIASYDVDYKDITTGDGWKEWKSATSVTSTTFYGQHGHIYWFRSRARDRVGNVEADLPALFDSQTKVENIDFVATGLEVTQVVQDLNNSVILISGKRTFVRLHVRTDSVDYGPVRAYLSARRNGVSLGTLWTPSNPGGQMIIKRYPDRGVLTDTFYFDIPLDWASGTVQFIGTIDSWVVSLDN